MRTSSRPHGGAPHLVLFELSTDAGATLRAGDRGRSAALRVTLAKYRADRGVNAGLLAVGCDGRTHVVTEGVYLGETILQTVMPQHCESRESDRIDRGRERRKRHAKMRTQDGLRSFDEIVTNREETNRLDVNRG